MEFPLSKNENEQKLLLNEVLCIVLILDPCVIAMMIADMLLKGSKTLNLTLHFTIQGKTKEK
jgi:hypothetical protein